MGSLEYRQSLSLEEKIILTKKRIIEFSDKVNGIYVSFSGGKDSTVLLDLVRDVFPETPAVFINTGLEFPEIVEFVNQTENVVKLRPRMPFNEVLKKYGYPVISKEQARYIYDVRNTKSEYMRNLRMNGSKKRYFKVSNKWKFALKAPFKISDNCCNVLKKNPAKSFEKQSGLSPIIGTMAGESSLRKNSYVRNGCNIFGKRPKSSPMSFWLEQDVWDYIKLKKLSYSKIYDMGYDRTGCIFCGFGVHLEKGENRFQKLKRTHPKLHKYCMEQLGMKEVLEFMKVPTEEHIQQTTIGGLDD